MALPRKIALFGGSFDPIHQGHLHIATCAQQAFGLDEVRFIPCQVSPHKQKAPPAPVEDRLAMLRLATQEISWATVDDIEARQPGPSYSWQTAEALHQQFPQAQLFWIMGTDQWQALERWDQPQRLAACVEFIVFRRGEHPTPKAGFTLHPLPTDHPASSSEIRIHIHRGSAQHPWLSNDVSAWITQHKLYR